MKLVKIVSVLTMFCGLVCCNAQSKGFRSLSVEEYAKAIADASVVRVDVRTAEEYAEGHIEGAINLDVQKADFESLAKVTLPKDRTIAVNCRSGKRSKNAATLLAKNGYKVIELNKGYTGWTNAQKPVTKEEVDLFVTPTGTLIRMHCIKHGSLRMQVGDKWIYVDPVTDKVQPVTDYSGMAKADVILITHEHADHLDAKAIEQLTKPGTVLITNPRSSEQLQRPCEVMKNGESKTVGGLRIDAVPAYNNSADKQQFHPKGRDNGYVLSLEGFRIYVAGDTEDIEEMSDVKNIDVCFLPCNLPFTMTPEQLSKAARVIKPKVLFPYHYGQTQIQQVADLLAGSETEVRIRQYQ